MKRFTCGVIWVDGGAHNRDYVNRSAARAMIEELEKSTFSRQVPHIYVATTAGMGGLLGRYKIFVLTTEGTWHRDLNFERQVRQHAEHAGLEKLKKEKLENREFLDEVKNQGVKILKGAKAEISIGGEKVSLSDGDINFTIQELGPIELSIQLVSNITDEDVANIRKQFEDACVNNEWRVPTFETLLSDEDIAKIQDAMTPQGLIGGSPLEIEDLDLPPLKQPDKKDTSDHEIDELNRALGIKK
jgi:hypothetical protein